MNQPRLETPGAPGVVVAKQDGCPPWKGSMTLAVEKPDKSPVSGGNNNQLHVGGGLETLVETALTRSLEYTAPAAHLWVMDRVICFNLGIAPRVYCCSTFGCSQDGCLLGYLMFV